MRLVVRPQNTGYLTGGEGNKNVMGSKEFTNIIASEIGLALSPHGFRLLDTTFIADREEVTFLISLYKQSSTRKDRLVLSIYVGVYSKALARFSHEQAGIAYVSEPQKLRWYNCHWKRNIAYAQSDDQGMRFWRVESELQALEASKEIIEILQDWGLPYLENLSSTAKLATYWRNGGGANINEPASTNCLKILDDLLLKRLIGG